MILLELTFSLLSTWTLVAVANWLRQIDVCRFKEALGSKKHERQIDGGFDAVLTDKTTCSIANLNKGYLILEYPGVESQPRSYYNLFSEDDPVCYSLSDLDEFSDSILADLEEIEHDISPLHARRTNLPLVYNNSLLDNDDSC